MHCEVLLPSVVLLVDYRRGLGWLASQMSVPIENYFEAFTIRNRVFIIQLIILLSSFVYKKSFHNIHMCTFSGQMFNIHYAIYFPEGVAVF